MRLQGKSAIVTGSTQGIGAAIAKRFGQEGAKVAIVASKDIDRARKVADEIRAAGGAAEPFVADCSNVSAIDTLVSDVIQKFGGLDIIVNNAGIMHTASIEETTEEIWDEQLDLNLKGVFFLARAALPHFKKQESGKIINVSSIWGIGAGPNCPAYCAAKGGVVNLTRALAVEIGRYNINVNSIAPGNIATPLNAHLRGPGMEHYVQQMRNMTPTGRDFLDPEELTGAAVFLASADSDAVHGQTVAVDAGWSAW